MNLSAFLLTPPPRMIRFGQKSLSIAWRCSSRSAAQAFHDRPRRVRATAADRRSASRPRISMWPSSVFGTRTPSLNIPEPRPVPRVRTNTTPALARARPEAHLGEARGVGVVDDRRPSRRTAAADARARSKSTQPGSMFAAVIVTPSMTTDGMPTPTGSVLCGRDRPSRERAGTVRMMIGTTTSGVDGCGVGDAQARSDEHAARRRRRRRLDPAAADVDPDRAIRPGRVGVGSTSTDLRSS